jgi:hypothetical protein
VWLQRELHVRDVARDEEYPTRFGGFYRVRRGSAWRQAFFGTLQDARRRPAAIGEILERLHRATNRIEASFSNKLVATVDPSQPVIDSVVFRNLAR